MSIDPSRTTEVGAADLTVGHAVVIPGTGAFIVREVRSGGPTGRLALLLWDDLALLLRRGTTRTVLLPSGDTPARHRIGPTHRPDGGRPPTLPLAG